MGLNFRKIFRFGGFRTSLSKSGVGVSWGIPGLRFGVNSQGNKYFTIGFPGLGIYFTKTFRSTDKMRKLEGSIPTADNEPEKTKSTEKGNSRWWNQKYFKK